MSRLIENPAQNALGLNPEHAQGIDAAVVRKIHSRLLKRTLAPIRDRRSNNRLRKESWEWVLDALFRKTPLAGTFRACCTMEGVSSLALLQILIQKHEDQVEEIFGEGSVKKLLQLIERNLDYNREELPTQVLQ